MSGAMNSNPQITLTVGAVLLYVGGRVAFCALAQGSPAPGRRAVGHWLPVAAVALAAALLGQAVVAIEIIFATSVAALALIGGCIAVTETHGDEPPLWPTRGRKLAAMLLPATVLAFMAGFGGQVTIVAAILLLAQGAIILFVQFDPADQPAEPQTASQLKFIPLLLALILCAVGGWAAAFGTIGVSAKLDFPSPLPLVTTVLCPLLVASMLPGGSTLAQRGKAWAAAATHVGLTQLNLCLLLPLLAIIWRERQGESLYYPLSTWRVDAVVLMILAAALLPAAAGRWQLSRSDGVMFIIIYVGYVLATIVVSV